MAIVRTDDKHYKDIADTLRMHGIDKSLKPGEMPMAIGSVASNKFSDGLIQGQARGIELGKAEMSETFWSLISYRDKHTNMCQRMDFSVIGGFNPPFQIKPVGEAGYAFNYAKNMGVITAKELDLSEVTNFQAMFDHTSGFTEIELIDARNGTNFTAMINENYSLKKIGKFILKDDGSQTMQNSMFSAHALEEIRIEGKFGSDVNFRYGKYLTYESLLSIVNALSTTTTGKTITLNKIAVNNAFGINVDDVTTYPEESEWYILRNSRSNWNFSYA